MPTFMHKKTVNFSDLITLSRPSPKWVWDAQGELVEVAANQPAYNHDPVTGDPLGFDIDPAVTNYIPSNDMSASPWGNPASRVTVTPVAGFIGASVPCFEVATAAAGVGSASRVQVQASLPAGDCVVYIIAKPGTSSEMSINMFTFTDPQLEGSAIFYLDTQTAISNNPNVLDYGIEDIGLGRSLCWLKVTSASGGTGNIGFYPDSDAEGNSFLAGAPQVTDGPNIQSYVPTTGSVLMREADVPVIESLDTVEWFDEDAFTFHMRMNIRGFIDGEGNYPFGITAGGSSNYGLLLIVGSSGNLNVAQRFNSSTVFNETVGIINFGEPFDLSVSVKNNGAAYAKFNGAVTTLSENANVTPGISEMRLGKGFSANNASVPVFVEDFQVEKRGRTAAELQEPAS